ncbi:hypothetical protein [Thalassospira sp.]|uniref:hypothetical protein n=1 Tax=Thalassospira sp. TaxID=1912094 RepID=UPI0032EC8E09
MSIGANWRQISPGSVPGVAGDIASDKFAQSNVADQLSDSTEGRSFSDYMFGEDGFEFTDFLDVINPLQHIPGVGMVYRSLTGDELGNGARVVGGGLFGGVFGLAGAAIDAVVDAVTGEDTGAHVMAFVEDSFNGSPRDDGTAIADASENPATAMTTGGYQEDLVLPWMAANNAPSSFAANPAEQATIVQAAPMASVDQVVLASAGSPDVPVTNVINASELNLPWAQNAAAMASAPTPAPNPLLQAQLQAQTEAAPVSASEQNQDSDPAELAVAMASAGTTNPASTFAQTVAANSSTADALPRASFSNEGGNTVWARAQSEGRFSRQSNTMVISAEMAQYEARQAKLSAGKTDKQSSENVLTDRADTATTDNVASRPAAPTLPDLRSGAAPLSAAEMAARFNAALGREKAQTMAAESVASSNAVADQGRMAARQTSQGTNQSTSHTNDVSANITAQNEVGADSAVHPLMQRASSHLEADEPVGAWFSQTMMDGLKKYQAMQKQSQPSGGSI